MTAFDEGYHACEKSNGVRVANPYATGTREAAQWEDGWAMKMDETKADEE